jgi:hypothetical protein
MSYAQSLLADGEVMVLRTRQHPLALVKDARYGLALWLLAVALVVAVPIFNLGRPLSDYVAYVALACLGIGLLIVIWQYLLWLTEEYIVTNRRLLKVNGLVNKRSADSSLEKINDAILTVNLWGRIFNYGDLDILTASDQTVDSYRMLNNVRQFKKVMLNQKHALELEYSMGRAPSPPFRAGATPAPEPPPTPTPEPPAIPTPEPASSAATPEPVMAAERQLPPPPLPQPAASQAASEPAPTVSSAAEITQTLARLADLRDSGAISEDEYQAKKEDLLRRL